MTGSKGKGRGLGGLLSVSVRLGKCEDRVWIPEPKKAPGGYAAFLQFPSQKAETAESPEKLAWKT